MNEDRLREALRAAPIEGEEEARERALALARAAFASSHPTAAPRRPQRRRVLQLAVAVGLLVVAISPAGAAVRHLVSDAVESGGEPALPALTSLPAPGSLLVDSARGPWVVREDGSKRLLGPYGESAWSPHGLNVVATSHHQLLAVDPGGEVRWSLARKLPVRRPAWSPEGYRIAYLSGKQLRLVAGDGTGDRLLVPAVAPVAPAWAPRAARVLSFVTAKGRVRTIEAMTGETVFDVPAAGAPLRLEWSANGERLLVSTGTQLQAFDSAGRAVWSARAPRGTEVVASAISHHGERAATVLVSKTGDRSELVMLGPGGGGRTLFEGLGRFGDVVYSPDGEWLLLAWRSADQWLFLNPADPQSVVAIADIAAQFDPGTTSPPAFPRVAGWCCVANEADG